MKELIVQSCEELSSPHDGAIGANDLEEALLLLPFHLVEALVRRLANLLGQRGLDHELVARCKSSFVRSFVCSFS
jgi:hypothetical protein